MSDFWLINDGAEAEYGPVNLAQLRGMVAAGLIREDTRIRDQFSNTRRITTWPELLEALRDPRQKTWGGTTYTVGTTGWIAPLPEDFAQNQAPAESTRESPLTLGRAVFDSVNARDHAQGFETLHILAANKASEPEKPIVMPPWYEFPWAVNTRRYLTIIALAYGGAYAYVRIRGGIDVMGAVAGTVGLLIITFGFAWFIFIVSPYTWNDVRRPVGKLPERPDRA